MYWKWQSVRESYGCWCRRSWWPGTPSKSAIPFPCRFLRPPRTIESGQAVNRPSPILAHVTFCVQTVNTPETMFPKLKLLAERVVTEDFHRRLPGESDDSWE